MDVKSRGTVRVEPSAKRVRAYLAGRLVADTRHPALVWEVPYYPAYYIPAGDVRAELSPTGATEHSPSRGDAVLYDVRVDGAVAGGAARRYPDSPLAAIRDLVMRGRINATSVMVVAPHFNRSEALALNMLNAGTTRVAIGLHLTLTSPFRPMTERFRPLHRSGRFPPLRSALLAATLRRYRMEPLRVEIATQLAAFRSAFGHAPDFIDGHQHVQLFPQIRDAVVSVGKAVVPNAWIRQCGREPHMRIRGDRKGAMLDRLSVKFCRLAEHMGVRTNTAFAGTYDFHAGLDFAKLFPAFIDGMPEFGLVMCAVIVLLYLAIIARVLVRLSSEEDLFTVLSATGLISLIGGQAFVNILVNLQLFPSKGMTLPLVSYGGSSTIALCLTVGLLLALTRRNPYLPRNRFDWLSLLPEPGRRKGGKA